MFLRKVKNFQKKMNKKNLNKLSITVFIIFIFMCLFLVNVNVSAISQDLIDMLKEKHGISDEPTTIETNDLTTNAVEDATDKDMLFEKLNKETPGVIVNKDGSFDFSKSKGGIMLSKDEIKILGIKKIISKNEVINIENADIELIYIKDGITKITFAESDTSSKLTFVRDGKAYEITARMGTVEWINEKIRFSDGITIITSDGKSFTSLKTGTEITLGEVIEIRGKASLDYKQDSLGSIKLLGKGSSLQLVKSEKENIEFENIDGKDIIIKTGEFHKTEECEGNCVSYKDMMGWSKAKIDGNVLVVKSFGDETRTIRFENGNVKIYRATDLEQFKEADGLSQKIVINYNNAVALSIEKSGEIKADKYGFYDEKTAKAELNNQGENIQNIVPEKIPETVPTKLTQLEEKSMKVKIGDISLYDKVSDIYAEYPGGSIKKSLFISLLEKESSMDQKRSYYFSYGLTQATLSAVNDLIKNEPEYKDYKGYSNEKLANLLKNDAGFNLKVGFDYLTRIEKHYGKSYGFSEPKKTYNYDGDEVDIYLMAYNAGPTVTNKLMTAFKAQGGGDWSDLKAFIKSDKGIAILGRDKAKILPGYVDDVTSGAK